MDREQAIQELTRRANKGDSGARQILKDKNIIEPFEPTGGIGKFIKDATKPAATIALRPAQALGTGIASAFGKTPTIEQQTLEVPFFGKIAPPVGRKDVVRDIGRVAETASLGIGGGGIGAVGKAGLKGALKKAFASGAIQSGKAGAVFGAGSQLERGGTFNTGTVGSAALGGFGGALTGGGLGAGIAGGSLTSQAIARAVARRLPSNTPGVLGRYKKTIALKDAIEVTRPVLDKKGRVAAIRSGQAEESGLPFFKKVKIVNPSKRDLEVAKASSGVVRANENQIKNITRIDDEVTSLNQNTREYVASHNAIFDNKQLISRLKQAKEESRVIFGSDDILERRYDSVIDELMRNIKKNDLDSLLEARMRFDAVVRQKFPRTFVGDTNDNVTRNAILDVRRAANEFIAENLPKNSPFKPQLKQQHLLLEAAENLAEQAELKVPSNRRGLANYLMSMIGGGFLGAVGGSVLGGIFGRGGGE